MWEWNNAADVREHSFTGEKILWEDHQKWFDDRMSDPECLVLVAEHEGAPIGQIRFQSRAGDATVSIVLDGRFRGRGFGTDVIRRGTSEFFRRTGPGTASAHIKVDNLVSLQAFLKAGYTEISRSATAVHLQAYHR